MSEIEYIEIPIETDPEELSIESFDYLVSKLPDWVPNDANLETIFVEALARMTAEARDVASAAPTEIFRYYGSLVGILPIDATSAESVVTITVIDTLGYTIPALTNIGIRTAGDEIIAFQTVSDTVIPNGSSVATDVIIKALEPGVGGNGLDSTLVTEILDPLEFVVFVDLTEDTGGGTDAETTDAYLNRLTARLTLLTDTPILPDDFAILALDIPGVARAVAVDLYNPGHNLLTVNQSSLETDLTGWAAGTNCTILRVTTPSSDGGASMRLRSTAGGDMNAVTPSGAIDTAVGTYWAAIAEFRSAVSARNCRVGLQFYTGAGAPIGSPTYGTAIADTTTGWVQAIVSGIAPTLANWVGVSVQVQTTGGATEDHFVDKIALKHYGGPEWGYGGTPEFNNERMVTIFSSDELGQPISLSAKTALDSYLQSLREVNFIVNVADPTYTTIDVTFAAKAVLDYDITTVEAATEEAITNYLSPQNWGLPSILNTEDALVAGWINQTWVRYLELTTVVNNVPGLDYITSLTFSRAGETLATGDILLGGPVPLPLPGTIAGTIT